MLWIWAAIISTCYTLTWDIKMDWGLLDRKAPQENRFLREETVYRYKVGHTVYEVDHVIYKVVHLVTCSLTHVT